jgi:spore coat polysaccharide biosynthesis protein SpsF
LSKKNPEILIVIQARRGSTRLPDKIMMPLAGKPLLVRMVERVQASKTPAKIVVATTTDESDDIVEKFCKENNIECFRGHPTDLLERHYECALKYKADVVSKIPSDCPLIDPQIIDKVFEYYLKNDFDFVSNLHPATYPDGNDIEIMSFDVLETAYREAVLPLEREHTTPFIWERPERFKIGNVEWKTGLDYSKTHRFTIDYIEDYEFIKWIYDELYSDNPLFGLTEILNLLSSKPEIYEINQKYAGEYWYKNHIGELKTVKYSTKKNND